MPSIVVHGMSCQHCQKAVTEAIAAVPGVESVVVSLEQKTATWTGASTVDPASVREAVESIGFDSE